jgi:hypothetical protein
MVDWHALYESWDKVPEEKKKLIEKLFREKPKEKLTELFEREPYAKMVYEKLVGKWKPPPPPEAQSPQEELTKKETAQFSERRTPKNTVSTPAGNKGAILLPILTLITILSAEIAYYSSQSVTFLDSVLPFNLKTWLILLILALGLGLVSSIYILKHLTQRRKLDQTLGGNSL